MFRTAHPQAHHDVDPRPSHLRATDAFAQNVLVNGDFEFGDTTSREEINVQVDNASLTQDVVSHDDSGWSKVKATFAN